MPPLSHVERNHVVPEKMVHIDNVSIDSMNLCLNVPIDKYINDGTYINVMQCTLAYDKHMIRYALHIHGPL